MGLLVTWAVAGCVALLLPSARSDGNVGCLFSPSLCIPDVEWCYNDDAFGRCLQENIDEEDLYRHELSPDELQELEREMERLLNLGYRWSHSYTQCLLQAMLYAYRIRTVFEPEVCNGLKDQDLSAALKAFESEKMALDPQNVAYVKFTPSAHNPHADFADEVYFPPAPLDTDLVPVPLPPDVELLDDYFDIDEKPERPERPERLERLQEEVPVILESLEDEADYPSIGYSQKQFPFSLVRKKSLPERRSLHFNPNYNTPDDFRRGFETKDHMPQPVQESDMYNTLDGFRGGDGLRDRFLQQVDLPPVEEEEPSDIDPSDTLLIPMLRTIADTYPSPRQSEGASKLLEELSDRVAEEALQNEGEVARGYTEGGLVLIPEKHEDEDQSLSEFLVGLNSDINWGFKRPERLDVKKPGPPFKTNNYAFKAQTEGKPHPNKAEDGQKEKSSTQPVECSGETQTEGLAEAPFQHEASTLPRPHIQLQTMEEELIAVAPEKKTNFYPRPIDPFHGPMDPLNKQYRHYMSNNNVILMRFKEKLDSWMLGERIVMTIIDLLHLPKSIFGETRVHHNLLLFRVIPNKQNLNASRIVKEIEKIKYALEDKMGMTMTSVSVADEPMYEDVQMVVSPQKKTYSPTEIDMSGSDQYDIVDNNFAFIKFKEIIHTWIQGEKIVKKVAELLQLPEETFGEMRVDRNEVTFRVLPNKQDLNASAVAKKIEGIKDVLKKELKVTVTSAGIGDKTKLPSMISLNADADHEFFIVPFIVSVVFLTVMLSATLLFLIRRYTASRAKIRNLTTPDTEASKDYQELCRARMAAKPPHDAAAPTAATHRIASLSRESDNSPSSRSSTSSWSEEPALSSMDISTGHMVLSYMEDHLRNKDRLETEWAALCAYEAEPCATIIAQRPENAKKNRYVNALPYDHARVVLNELSNISGSDYINASTITDHDPRNPAYIATQGALPHTAPDLWQMVWEQGCVVMVMLTRLIENDVSLCHRYWPEEGSELYHIYEVHLVSEHFWCDDYLVRSFYLKNLKTTETRTVTQFHFLSWPEGGVPVSTKALLEFRRKVNKSFRGRSCPIVVHCSDGVGRTGTYCLLDMVLNRMAKGAKEIDIAATLEHIRDQRGGSVATKQQFQFVLSAVAEEVQAILRILPQQKADPPPTTQPSAQ